MSSLLSPLRPSASVPALSPKTEKETASIESTLSQLSQYRNVRGVMVVARPSHPAKSGAESRVREGEREGGIVQISGQAFEGEGGERYARVVERMVAGLEVAVDECEEGDELKLVRIRTKKHELIITPAEKYVLVVLQDPGE
ncbi:hypothetical protein L202_01777 [Cryptococcus amylolentus CBS 6039]|uniref:Roadblock/LAMTOR2 domain-containing protein n=2 Tax=Cryptococcus amylolentus TaxID=104669 RepID=A0A1E3I7A1_9TREE|nr:hypothetical protein L202_01777 [Cryptococcus amylolentus CBS 6039]ODN83681.1 hypothetical protein L202_01777 [Cryptococcus amylolentus CBS 6039]ODO11156.1 hypothetical protein I350_01759 [Cryptococcus amylolentus CBS 6273]